MHKQTDHERIIAQEIRKSFHQMMSNEVSDSLNGLSIQMISREDAKNILVIRLHEEVLDTIQQKPANILAKFNAMFPEVITILVRNAEIKGSSGTKESNSRIEAKNLRKNVYEAWARDICLPATYEMRTTTVLTTGEKQDTVYISKVSEQNADNLDAMEKVYFALTGQEIKYKLI